MPFLGGRLINCYSYSDWILLSLFKISKMLKTPVGRNEIKENKKIINYNFSHLGHLNYEES